MRESKRDRQEARRSAADARRRRRNFVRGAIVGLLLLGPFLWLVDRAGSEEVLQARVVRTHLYRHTPAGGASHTHVDATVVIEGLNEVRLRRVAGFQEGQQVWVRVRRGLLTGWPYFLEIDEGGAPPLPAGGPAGAAAEELNTETVPEVQPGTLVLEGENR